MQGILGSSIQLPIQADLCRFKWESVGSARDPYHEPMPEAKKKNAPAGSKCD
jgi:hypothetical protein